MNFKKTATNGLTHQIKLTLAMPQDFIVGFQKA
jgi:hypothetical protein